MKTITRFALVVGAVYLGLGASSYSQSYDYSQGERALERVPLASGGAPVYAYRGPRMLQAGPVVSGLPPIAQGPNSPVRLVRKQMAQGPDIWLYVPVCPCAGH